ncbi:MAG: shikimate kinase, partial [Pseudomonadota bacterium]|nr:shikimate kinase [Pseudomonadota bacterium]
STGGGAFLAEENRRMISERGVSIWLNANTDVLWQRVRHRDSRPLLKTGNPRETLETLFAARHQLYAQADIAVVSDAGTSIEDMVDRVIAALGARPDVLAPE